MNATHQCPGCHVVRVQNKLLSCLACWQKLPPRIQREVTATMRYPLLHPRRAAVLQSAVEFWCGLED